MKAVTLRSRIPQIMAQMPQEVKDAALQGAQRIADDASARAPRGPTGDLADSIEAKETENGAGVYAIWRWFFTEFGTTNAGAQPFMVPALEASKENVLGDIENALEDL